MELKIILLLFLCSFINISLAKVGFGPGEQEWGYVEVRPKAHMFWWLYYTTADVGTKYEEKPLIIWIQGGPGVSGTGFGNFEELGPLDLHLEPRNYTWVKDYNVLFIDNPVGTGFSYVESTDLLAKNNSQIAKDLMQCIREFYKDFPKFVSTPTYILAESYGGKVTVEFTDLWYQEQTNGNIKSNLKGIGLVNSLVSSNDMYKSLAPYLYNLGMIDSDGYEKIDGAADRFINASAAGEWLEATYITNEIEFLMQSLTYGLDRLNVLGKVSPKRHTCEPLVIVDAEVGVWKGPQRNHEKGPKDSGVEKNWGTQETDVFQALLEDCRKPVVHLVEKLLNKTDIKVYVLNGQLDVIINTPGVYSWVKKLNWKHAENWKSAPRLPLVVDNIIEGYSKGYGNLKLYWVNRSGHMVPAGNPGAMEKILLELVYNQ